MSRPGDSKHQIVEEVSLCAGGVLHRFNNGGGVPYSAIYVDGQEIWSLERESEKRMVRAWNLTMQSFSLNKESDAGNDKLDESKNSDVPKLHMYDVADVTGANTPKPYEEWLIPNMLGPGYDMLIMGSVQQQRSLTRSVFKTMVAIGNNKPVFGRETHGDNVRLTYLSTRGSMGVYEDMDDLDLVAEEMGVDDPHIDVRYLNGDERTSDGMCSIIKEISERTEQDDFVDVVVIDNLDWMLVPPCSIGRFIINTRPFAKNIALVFVCTTEYDDVIGYQSMGGLYPSTLCDTTVQIEGDSYKVIQDFLTM